MRAPPTIQIVLLGLVVICTIAFIFTGSKATTKIDNDSNEMLRTDINVLSEHIAHLITDTNQLQVELAGQTQRLDAFLAAITAKDNANSDFTNVFQTLRSEISIMSTVVTQLAKNQNIDIKHLSNGVSNNDDQKPIPDFNAKATSEPNQQTKAPLENKTDNYPNHGENGNERQQQNLLNNDDNENQSTKPTEKPILQHQQPGSNSNNKKPLARNSLFEFKEKRNVESYLSNFIFEKASKNVDPDQPYLPGRVNSKIRQSTLSQVSNTKLESKKMVVGIISAYNNTSKREAVRNSWLKFPTSREDWDYKFFVGLAPTQQERDEVEREQSDYGDIEIVGMADTYHNLTYKTLAIARWAIMNYQFAYLMKTDDDSFVRPDWLIQRLDRLPKTRLFAGTAVGSYRPIRDPTSPFYVTTEFFPYNAGPTLLLGAGYVMSYDMANYMALRSFESSLVLFPFEDVNTAFMLREIGVSGVDLPGFEEGPCMCREGMLLTHHCAPETMMQFYEKTLVGNHNMCS